ncbi:hypothetical protein PVMG_01012 [Plasmodium vivax Mauritania I]|uniref:GTP-binding protein EngA n=1 Tax=Plasmodium vivax Mauritania I TaxID=1035515 RepID=A0A0J9TER1_PLAVI|nr:hypothetical protein PVMG_01012 [Plasmodium vivax Mauritania I]
MGAAGVVRSLCFRISIVGASNSGKSSLHNRLMKRLSGSYKQSPVHHEPNYSLENHESPFRVENTKCVITDTLGMNEQMIRRLQGEKHHPDERHHQCNNIIRQHLNLIRSSHLILFCVKCSQIRQSDILAYQTVKDIFTQRENLITILFDERVRWDGRSRVEDDVATKQSEYNFLHAFEEFSNVVFFPNGLAWQDQGEDLVALIRRKVREEVAAHAGGDLEEAPTGDHPPMQHRTCDHHTCGYPEPPPNEQLRDLVDESLRIFRPKLSEETRNYFFKFVDLRKKEKTDERLFNDFMSERILGKSLRKLTRGELLARGAQAEAEAEAEAEAVADGEATVGAKAKAAAEEEPVGEDAVDAAASTAANTANAAAKAKNKRVRLLQAIVGGQGGVNPYELVKLTRAGDAPPVGAATPVGEATPEEDTTSEEGAPPEDATPEEDATSEEDATPSGTATPPHLQVCFLGERNCGKTTLIEAILRRPIVREQDVAELFGRKKYINRDLTVEHRNVQITIADTCSLTKQHRFKEEDSHHEEERRVFTNVHRSDLCVYVKEAKENNLSVSREDKKMIFYLLRKKKNIIVVVTKTDAILSRFEEKRNEFLSSFLSSFCSSFSDIPVLFLNPNNQMHVQTLLNRFIHIHKMSHLRIPTSTLNLFLIRFLQLFPIPWVRKKKCSFKYIRQVNTNPVTFLIFTNLYSNVPSNYLSFFKKKLKDQFRLRSVNVQFIFRTTCDSANARRGRLVRAGGRPRR